MCLCVCVCLSCARVSLSPGRAGAAFSVTRRACAEERGSVTREESSRTETLGVICDRIDVFLSGVSLIAEDAGELSVSSPRESDLRLRAVSGLADRILYVSPSPADHLHISITLNDRSYLSNCMCTLYISMCVCVYIYVCVCAYIYIYIYIYTHTHIYIYTHIYTYNMYTHKHTYIYIYIYIYIYTHTHTRIYSSPH